MFGPGRGRRLKDPRLVPGLKKVAAYHVEGKDYDCRPKWMAIAALARQESPNAVPVLVNLVDHGDQNTRFWARAALARMAKNDFKADKQAWNKWWVGQGHDAIDPALLKPYTPWARRRSEAGLTPATASRAHIHRGRGATVASSHTGRPSAARPRRPSRRCW